GLLVSGSRSALLSLFQILTLYFIVDFRRRVVKLFVLSTIIFITLFFSFKESVLNVGSARIEVGLHGRQVIWRNAIEVYSSVPFRGVGFGLENERIHALSGIRWTMHNGYLTVLTETGIIGFALVCLFICF